MAKKESTPMSYEMKLALDNLDEAFVSLISSCCVSGEELYSILLEKLKDLHDYYSKPANTVYYVMNKMNSALSEKEQKIKEGILWDEWFQNGFATDQTTDYDPISIPTDSSTFVAEQQYRNELEAASNKSVNHDDILIADKNGDLDIKSTAPFEDIRESVVGRSIRHDTYMKVINAFKQALDLDISNCSFSTCLYKDSELRLIPAQIMYVWNTQIIAIIKEEILKHNISYTQSIEKILCNYKVNSNTVSEWNTFFDLVYALEQQLEQMKIDLLQLK